MVVAISADDNDMLHFPQSTFSPQSHVNLHLDDYAADATGNRNESGMKIWSLQIPRHVECSDETATGATGSSWPL